MWEKYFWQKEKYLELLWTQEKHITGLIEMPCGVSYDCMAKAKVAD